MSPTVENNELLQRVLVNLAVLHDQSNCLQAFFACRGIEILGIGTNEQHLPEFPKHDLIDLVWAVRRPRAKVSRRHAALSENLQCA